MRSLLLTSAAIILAAGVAQAGSYVEPAPEPVIVPPAPIADFAGFYGGVTLGFGSGRYGNDDLFPGDGEGDLDGEALGLVLGYSGQSGNFVFGGELTYSAADINGTEACVNPGFECAMDIDEIITLRGRLGYVMGPSTMIYGTAGWAQASMDVYTDDGAGPYGEEKNTDGYVIGVGLEHAVSSNVHIRGEILYHDFESDDYDTDVTYDDVDADFTMFQLGVVFQF